MKNIKSGKITFKRHFAILFLMLVTAGLITNCRNEKKSKTKGSDKIPFVTAQAETKPVPRDPADDAADDPAIWINYKNPDSSRIIGTDKKGGLGVYNLEGKELFYYNTGLMNNADIRYRFPLGSDTIDIMAVSNRTDQSVDLYRINRDGSLQIVHNKQLLSKLKEEVYGLCMYQSKITGKYYVFVNDKTGVVEQWELYSTEDKVDGQVVRDLKLGSQVEGMVADDETGTLYVGEEDKGIWKFNAEPSGPVSGELIPMSGEPDNQNIKSDIEGLAIYELAGNEGYLIASSQGNSTYAVFERKLPNKYLGSFKVANGACSDGTEETDGTDVTSFPVSNLYPKGLMVIQDGSNKDNEITVAQNYKLIRWDSIASKFNPPLIF